MGAPKAAATPAAAPAATKSRFSWSHRKLKKLWKFDFIRGKVTLTVSQLTFEHESELERL